MTIPEVEANRQGTTVSASKDRAPQAENRMPIADSRILR
jgi:hypothetical protein